MKTLEKKHMIRVGSAIAVSLLTMVLLMMLVPLSAWAAEISGTLGDKKGIHWSYDEETKTLTITGEDSGMDGGIMSGSNLVTSQFCRLGIDCSNITKVVLRDCTIKGSAVGLFGGLTDTESFEFHNVDFSQVTNVTLMFYRCGMAELDLSGFDFSGLTSMQGMFYECKQLESINLSALKTPQVLSMNVLFWRCSALTEVDMTDVDASNVTDVSNLFTGCDALQRIHVPKKLAADTKIELPELFANPENSRTYYITDAFCDVVLTRVVTPFSDVSADSWKYEAVKYVYKNGVMNGKGNDAEGNVIFEPDKPILREEFAQVLYNHSGKPSVNIENPFPDVKNTWYKNAVLWANENDIAKGYKTGEFGVGDSILRQDLALMLYKYAVLKGYDLTTTDGLIQQYADGAKVSDYAQNAMNWAITQGIMSGKGNKGEDVSTFKLDPLGSATRAECASMMMKLLTWNKFLGWPR